jgi:hypothetical protein
LPESVSTFRFDPKALRDVTPRQRSIYRGIICLILGSGTGARDFHTLAIITGKLILEEGIDDHHIFPASFLDTKKGVSLARLRDCVLNRSLIDRTTNQMISDRAPSDYLKEIRNTAGFPFDEVLESHCLPTGEKVPYWDDDYESFLAWRQQRLWKEIQRATGVVEATDLEATNGVTPTGGAAESEPKFPSNPYDRYLWECLLEGGTADEIAAKVASHFAQDSYKVRRYPKTALKWIPETIDDMKAAGLVPKLKGSAK